MHSSLKGHLAAAGAYVIFGLNLLLCKDISGTGVVPPIVLFSLRAAGASALFWLLSLFLPRERVAPRDFPLIVLASFLGLFLTQLSFLVGIGMTTPIDAAVLSSLSPVYTMCFAFLFLGEPITGKKAGGVALSLLGVIWLIFNSVHGTGEVERTRPAGVLLMLVNGLSFAAYLGCFRPLIARYGVVTFMKWMFLFSLLMSLPFSWRGITGLDCAAITPKLGWEIAYLIVFATCIAYFLIPVGQKHLRPTLVSMYSYLQPIIAAVVGVALGMDRFTWQKVLATVLVFAGVILVNKSRAAAE